MAPFLLLLHFSSGFCFLIIVENNEPRPHLSTLSVIGRVVQTRILCAWSSPQTPPICPVDDVTRSDGDGISSERW